MTEDMGQAGVFRAGVKVGYCLTDFPEPRAGFTLFAPGSHRLTTPLPIPNGAVDPDGVADLCLSAGDAFLFENRVFHSTAPNLSKRTSKVVILGYSYRWMGGTRDNMRLVQPGAHVLQQVDAMTVERAPRLKVAPESESRLRPKLKAEFTDQSEGTRPDNWTAARVRFP